MNDNGPALDDGPAPDSGLAPDSQPAPDGQPAPDDRAVILFDGACNLCNAMVRWAGPRDPNGRFRFAQLQSDEAARLLARAGATAGDSAWARGSAASNCADPGTVHAFQGLGAGSIALVQGRKVHFRSGAVLRIALRLKFPYPLLAAGLLAPRPLRDAAYDWVARNRYKWFGRAAACPLPTTPQAQSGAGPATNASAGPTDGARPTDGPPEPPNQGDSGGRLRD